MRERKHDIHTPALPSFGSPVPTKFTATKEEYVSWIISRIEQFGEPVDLFGHDWGCILTMRVASLRPDLIRASAAGSGPVSAEFENYIDIDHQEVLAAEAKLPAGKPIVMLNPGGISC